ncbi:hypothetical protein KC867_02870 [Candidatus Saccharibacteria bacterium]|nr:hypothetical protein [Candidatus Saccharibacteria bacterium]
MFIKHKHLLGLTTFVLSLGVATILGGGSAQAATLNVSGGCTLPIAIDSVNAGADQAGCTATGPAYATDDTISIPAGTQTLTADLPPITESVEIIGAGINNSIIDGNNGQYLGFRVADVTGVVFNNLTVTAYRDIAIYVDSSDVIFENIEIDSNNATDTGALYGIYTINDDSNSHTLNSSNVYIHSMNQTDAYLHAFIVAVSDGGHTDATITNTTLSDIHTTGSDGINGIAMHVGTFGGDAMGTLDANISNTTVTNVTSEALTAPFNAAAWTDNDGGNSTINVDINNITITDTHGENGTGPITGIKSGAFYAAAVGVGASEIGTVNMTVSNSLMANNTSSGNPSNCAEGDFTPIFGGSGQGIPNIISAGYNISDDDSCDDFNQPGDQQNINNILSTLGPLQNNGGPVPTRALLAGSPAIASGRSVLGITTDARGIARPRDCPSVGAYEFEGAVCGTATTTPVAGGALAPNTGIKSSSQIFNILAGLSGLGLVTYIFFKQKGLN